MPSLVITKNDPADTPLFGDWTNDTKRQNGQVIAGQKLLSSFAVAGTGEETIVRSTIQQCWDNDCSIWMRYDGNIPDSFAIIDAFSSEPLNPQEQGLQPFVVAQVKLTYYKVKVAANGSPIVKEGGPEKLTLVVQNDSAPGKTDNKKMNVVIPSDFATFDDQYLKDMTEDIESMPLSEDVPYLLSSLTFRRCL